MQTQYVIKTASGDVNLTPFLKEDGVQETTINRRGKEIVLLDGTKRRWQITKRGLSFALLPMRMETLQSLAAVIADRLTLEYDDSQYGHTTREFYSDGIADMIHKISGGNTWVSDVSFSLEEV